MHHRLRQFVLQPSANYLNLAIKRFNYFEKNVFKCLQKYFEVLLKIFIFKFCVDAMAVKGYVAKESGTFKLGTFLSVRVKQSLAPSVASAAKLCTKVFRVPAWGSVGPMTSTSADVLTTSQVPWGDSSPGLSSPQPEGAMTQVSTGSHDPCRGLDQVIYNRDPVILTQPLASMNFLLEA
jgi:hypothetical protein